MKKKWWVVALVVIALLLVAGYLVGGYLVYEQMTNVVGSCDPHKANRPDRFTNVSEWKIDDIPEFELSNYFMPTYDEVHFPSRETNYDIAGWYVEGDPDQPAVILVDGMGGCRWTQAVLIPAGMLWRNGFNVLIIDLHETGDWRSSTAIRPWAPTNIWMCWARGIG